MSLNQAANGPCASPMTPGQDAGIPIDDIGSIKFNPDDNVRYCIAQMCEARVRRSKFNQSVRWHKTAAALKGLKPRQASLSMRMRARAAV